MRVLAAILLLSFAATNSRAADQFPRGEIIPKVITASNPAQSYALYLPKTYDPQRRWPVLFIFDPSANCERPMAIAAPVAEEFGYVLACSNNSRNGPARPQNEAASALLTDIDHRIAGDPQRWYAAGFSGGARVATHVGQACHSCLAGVLACGAGFGEARPPATAAEMPFDLFATVGDKDFNYPEMVRLSRTLAKLPVAQRLSVFSGPHQWASQELWRDAFAWFEIRAMKAKKVALRPDFVQAQIAAITKQADAAIATGEFTRAYALLHQAADDFDGLAPTDFARRAAELGSDKRLKQAIGHEDGEFAEQDRLRAEMGETLAGALSDRPGRFDAFRAEVAKLRQQRDAAKDESTRNVITRALAAALGSSFENGEASMEKGDFRLAQAWFEVTSYIALKPAFTYVNMARAQARAGNRKAALNSLKRALDLDPSVADPIRANEDLASLRSDPEFNKLLTMHAASTPNAAK